MQSTDTIYSPYNGEIEKAPIPLVSHWEKVSLLPETSPTDSLCYTSSIKILMPGIPLNKPDYLTGSLLYTIFFLSLFAFIRLRGKGILILLLKVLYKRKKADIVLDEGITPNIIYYISALTLSFSVLSVGVVYLVFNTLNWEYILYIFGLLVVYHIVILNIVKFTGWVFNARNIKEEAIVNIWTYHIMMGLLVSPFVLSIFFVKIFAIELLVKFIIICLILFYLTKFLRWIEILFAHRVSIFYMILYLCALEVIPLLVLYKFLV